jgi:hypothetical protein
MPNDTLLYQFLFSKRELEEMELARDYPYLHDLEEPMDDDRFSSHDSYREEEWPEEIDMHNQEVREVIGNV